MLQDEGKRRTEAIDWVIRQRDAETADWTGFTEWLEADPTNNAAYEAVALAGEDAAEAFADAPRGAVPSNDNMDAPRRGRFWSWGAAAAAVMAAAVSYPLLAPGTATYAVETKAGEHRNIALADGTRIDLNGDSRIVLRKGDDRLATLDRGEAAFTVVHDPANPFVVEVGDARLQDVGTMFNVTRVGDATEVAVAEGAVLYNPQAEAVRLDAGKFLRTSSNSDNVVVAAIDPTTIATWRQQRLIYQAAPLARVAADLSRNLGVPVSVSPDIAARPFSGVLLLDGAPAALMPRLGQVLDVHMTQQGKTWRLASRSRAAH